MEKFLKLFYVRGFQGGVQDPLGVVVHLGRDHEISRKYFFKNLPKSLLI